MDPLGLYGIFDAQDSCTKFKNGNCHWGGFDPKCAATHSIDLSCKNSSNDPDVPAGVTGGTTCSGNTITITIFYDSFAGLSEAAMLETLMHELVHANDVCKCGGCKLLDLEVGEDPEDYCIDGLCMEIRAYMLTDSTCNSQPTEALRKECVRLKVEDYLDLYEECGGDQSLLDDAMDKCYEPKTSSGPGGLPGDVPDWPLPIF